MKKPRKRKPVTKAELTRRLNEALGMRDAMTQDYRTAARRCNELTAELEGVRKRSTEILACHDAEKARAEREERAHWIAHATLAEAGWTLAPGASAWKPPIGKPSGPLIDEIDAQREEIRLANERAAAAEQNASRVKTEAAQRLNGLEASLADKSAVNARLIADFTKQAHSAEFYRARTIEYYQDRQTLRARLRTATLGKPPTHHDRVFLDSLKD